MQATQAPGPEGGTRRLLLFVGPDMQPDDALGHALARAGWRCVWLAGIAPALHAAAHAHFDAMVVQAEASGGPPARHIEMLRQTLGCPLLVVAPSADEVDEIIALELGADAYLTGALAPRRLRAHLHALMRRGDEVPSAADVPPALKLGRWSLDRVHQRLDSDERQVPLTGLQCALLQRLGEQAGRVVERAALAGALGGERELHARSIDVYVARLRRRLREQRVPDITIEGVRGRGYTLAVAAEGTVGGPRLAWVAAQPGVHLAAS